MRLVAKDRIPYIIIMRNLYVIEKNDILEFGRVADDGVFADDSASSNKGTVPYLGFMIYDARPRYIRGWKYLGASGNPDIFVSFLVKRRIQSRPDLPDELPDIAKDFPRELFAFKYPSSNGFIEIQKILNSYIILHTIFLYIKNAVPRESEHSTYCISFGMLRRYTAGKILKKVRQKVSSRKHIQTMSKAKSGRQ